MDEKLSFTTERKKLYREETCLQVTKSNILEKGKKKKKFI